MLRNALLLCLLALVGCSDDAADSTTAATDSGSPKDSAVVDSAVSPVTDSGSADTGATTDSGAADSTIMESGADTAAPDTAFDSVITWDTAGACHTFGFGAPPAVISITGSLPTMTGGTIPVGTYDVVAAKTNGSTGVGGTYQATWSFVDGNKIDAIEQLALSGTPPTPVPRTLTWSTTGTSLTRTQVCGGSSSFTNEYTVRTESGATFLDVRQTTLMFTFKKR